VELTVSILSFWPISLWAENAIIFPSRHYYCLFYFVIKLFKEILIWKETASAMSLEAWGEPMRVMKNRIAGS
jgi:hypothetical protein